MSAVTILESERQIPHGEAAQIDRGDKVQLLGFVLGMFAVLVVLTAVLGVAPSI
jgi:hypothetical protein